MGGMRKLDREDRRGGEGKELETERGSTHRGSRWTSLSLATVGEFEAATIRGEPWTGYGRRFKVRETMSGPLRWRETIRFLGRRGIGEREIVGGVGTRGGPSRVSRGSKKQNAHRAKRRDLGAELAAEPEGPFLLASRARAQGPRRVVLSSRSRRLTSILSVAVRFGRDTKEEEEEEEEEEEAKRTQSRVASSRI
ncbi:hypothetical protein KM043_004020 [Ampulex compressa]|nr:hypothetical protein KM043_004020 [Ampulex compressa]